MAMRVAMMELQPCAMLAKGPPCTNAGSLQLLVLGLECGKIAHDGWLGGFFTQELHGFVDFTGLDVRGSQTGGQQIELGLEIQETTGVQCQRLFLGDILGPVDDGNGDKAYNTYRIYRKAAANANRENPDSRSEEHTSELQSQR